MGRGAAIPAVKVVNMLILKCKGTRRLLYLSGFIFTLCILLQIVLNLLGPYHGSLPAYLPYLVFGMLLVGPILMLLAVLIALLPGEGKKMHFYEH